MVEGFVETLVQVFGALEKRENTETSMRETGHRNRETAGRHLKDGVWVATGGGG